ncbi:DUF190 domain-containing protein [Limisalsivibrio acetivorans]|uniref:DUF190 domain-containing protein n=1 Tax=Limisalsivibrio acetivorans TaxID=1304888 RepID=UPI0003B3AA89|nr:DUF190 domain-containing protein [Limisalsivibrio acetivorans]
MAGLLGKQKMLRIYISENDTIDGRPLYKAIVELCSEQGIAGATVLRGIYGYGSRGEIHSSRTLTLSSSLPLVVEIIDTEENIDAILPLIDPMMSGGMITIEMINVLKYE